MARSSPLSLSRTLPSSQVYRRLPRYSYRLDFETTKLPASSATLLRNEERYGVRQLHAPAWNTRINRWTESRTNGGLARVRPSAESTAEAQPHGKPARWNMIYPLVGIFIAAGKGYSYVAFAVSRRCTVHAGVRHVRARSCLLCDTRCHGPFPGFRSVSFVTARDACNRLRDSTTKPVPVTTDDDPAPSVATHRVSHRVFDERLIEDTSV